MARNNTDERVVQLMLDSKEFDQNAKKSIQSLDDLKKALEFEGASKGFENINNAARKVDLSIMDNGIQKVQNHFNALETIATTTLERITNSAIDTGVRLVKSLSTDQLSQGWMQYEDRTTAVQRIMSATSQQFSNQETQMEAVNEQLQKLTWFTDETSYKFNDIVNSIGKFTANNIKLEDATQAMEGISTWASLSGANINEAGRAMYNLAQAMAVGEVKLMDWRSIENANMGTYEFKQTAIETAMALGTLTRQADGLYKTLRGKTATELELFSDRLQDGWFSAEVLMQTLSKYGGFTDALNQFMDSVSNSEFLTANALQIIDDYVAGTLNMDEAMAQTGMGAEELTEWLKLLGSEEMELGRRGFKAAQETKTLSEAIDYIKTAVSSGWAQSFQYIFGDYTEAKEWWSEVSEALYTVFVQSGETRNALLAMWKELGGRDTFLDALRTLGKNVQGVLDSISGAWENIFGKTFEEQVQDLLNFTEGFKRFAEGIVFTEGTFQDFLRILESVFRVLKTIGNVLKTVMRTFEPFARLLNKFAGIVLRLVADLSELLSMKFENLFNEQRLQAAYNMLNTIAKVIAVLASKGIDGLVKGINMVIDGITALYNIFEAYTGGFDAIFLRLTELVWGFFDAFMNGETVVNKILNAILIALGGGVAGIYNLIKSLIDAFNGKEFKPEGTFGSITDWLGKVKEAFENLNLQEQLVGFLDGFRLLSSYIGEFFRDLQNADSELRQTFSAFGGELKIFYEWFKKILTDLSAEDIARIGMMIVIMQLILGVRDLTKGFAGLTKVSSGLVTTVNTLLKSLQDGNAESLMSRISGIFAKTRILQIGIGVTMLASAFNQINKMDYETTVRSLVLITASLGVLLVLFKKWSEISAAADELRAKNKKDSNVGLMILEIGASMLLLANAVKTMSEVMGNGADADAMAKALGPIFWVTVLASAMVGMMAALKKIDPGDLKDAAAAMLLLAGSITLMTVPVYVLSNIPWKELIAGIIATVALLGGVGGAAYLIKGVDWRSMLSAAVAFNAMAVAITALAIPVLALGAMTTAGGDMGAGLAATIALLGALAVAIGLLGKVCESIPPTVILSMSAAFISLSTSITILAGAAWLLQGVDFKSIGMALLALVGPLVLIGVAATAMSAIFGTLLTEAVFKMIDTFAGSMLKLGAALLAAGAGANLLVLAFEALSGGLIVLGLAATAFGDEWENILNKGLEATHIILEGIIDMILDLAPKIAMAVGAIWLAIKGAKWYASLEADAAKKVQRIGAAILGVLSLLGGALGDVLVKIIQGLNERIPDLIAALGEFGYNLLQGCGLLIRDLVAGFFMMIKAAFTGNWTDYNTYLENGFANSMGYAAAGMEKGGGQVVKTAEEIYKEAGEKGVLSYMNAIGASSPAREFIKAMLYSSMGLEVGGEDYLIPTSESVGEAGGNVVASAFEGSAVSGITDAGSKIRDLVNQYAEEFGADGIQLVNWGTQKKEITPFAPLQDAVGVATKKMMQNAGVELKMKETADEVAETGSGPFFDAGESLGSDLSKGVGSGAKKEKEKTAEEIVDEHLKAINDAYSRGVKQLDLASSRLDLKDKLWNLMNKEPGEEDTAAQAAYEAAKKEHELEMLDAQMEIQLGKINEAQANYTDKLNVLGSSAVETQEEYNNLLEQQYKILELYSEKQELMTEQSDSSADAFIAASKEVSSYHELLEQGLITDEMYLSAAQNKLAAFRKEESDLQKEHTTELDNSLAAVLERLEQNGGDLKDAFGAIMSDTLVDAIHNLPDNSEELSWSMTKVVSDGLEQVYLDPNFKESTEGLGVNIVDGAVNGLNDAKSTFVKVSEGVAKDGLEGMADELGVASPSKETYKFGQWIDDGLVNGILNRKAKVLEAAIAVAKGAIKAAKEALGIASPSKEFTAIGVLSDLGLARGLENGSDQVLKTGKKVVTNLLSTTKDELDQNGKYVSDYLKNTFGVSDETLRLQVIVDADTSLADASINELQRAYALKTGSLGAVDTTATFNAGSTDYLLQKLNEQEAFRATKLQSMYDLMASYVEMERLKSFEKSQGTEDSSTTIVNYNQTNVSPKPISALDTYRNTKKQLDTFETKIKGSKSGKKTYRV